MEKEIKDRIEQIGQGIVPEGYKQTKVGIIPDDWEVKKLGELGEVFRGKGIPKSKLTNEGVSCIIYGELYTTYNNIIHNIHSKTDFKTANNSFELEYGDLLFTGSGETPEEIGKSAIYLNENPAYAGGDLVILRPKHDIKNKVYGYLLNMELVRKQKYKKAQGHSVVHLYGDHINNIYVPIITQNEQQKIANVLSTWDRAIELKKSLIKEKEEQKKGLMQKLLTAELRFPDFGEEWKEIKISSFCQTYSGGTPSRKLIQYYKHGTIPWIKSGELNTRQVSQAEEFITKEGYKNSSAKKVQPNDILLALYGATAGVVAISKIEAAINQAVLAILPNNKVCNNSFLYYYLDYKMPNIVNKYTQGGQPNLSGGIIKNLTVSLPSLLEQEKISTVLVNCDKEIELLKQEVEQLKEQKKGLMQLLLTGIIRVKEDSDE